MRLMQLEDVFFCRTVVSQAFAHQPQENQNTPRDHCETTYDARGMYQLFHETSQIKQFGINGIVTTYRIQIDIFDIKVFSILMCKGSTL